MTSSDTENTPSILIDVSDLSLDEVTARLGDTALAEALRRITEEAVNPRGVPYAAFDSAIV